MSNAAPVPIPLLAKFLTILSQKASKYFLLREEGSAPKQKFEERLAALAAS